MQVQVPAALAIFLGSYFPLSLIILAQDFKWNYLGRSICISEDCSIPLRHPVFTLILLTITLVSLIATTVMLRNVKTNNSIVITDAKHVPAELMGYTLPYIVSFMSIEYQEVGKLVGLTIFLFWVFLITYSSGQIVLNPLLSVFGWKLYDIEYKYGAKSTTLQKGRALALHPPQPNSTWKSIEIQNVIIVRQ